MQRMTVPAGHNQTTRCYKRSTSEAFLCNAEEAQAFHYFPKKKRPGRWLAAAIVGLIVIALAGCSAEAAPQASKEKGAALACEGMTAVWISDTEHECLKETP